MRWHYRRKVTRSEKAMEYPQIFMFPKMVQLTTWASLEPQKCKCLLRRQGKMITEGSCVSYKAIFKRLIRCQNNHILHLFNITAHDRPASISRCIQPTQVQYFCLQLIFSYSCTVFFLGFICELGLILLYVVLQFAECSF